MPSDDEPRIRKSVKPETEVRLPPHLDGNHYEIIEHETPGRYERDSGDKRRDGGYRQQKYAPARIYFYMCIVLLAVCAVEIIALGITIADRQELQIKNQELQNGYDRLSGEIAALRQENEIERNKEAPEIDQIDYEDLEKIYNYFDITLSVNLKGGPPTLISVARPDQGILKNLGFDSEKLFIKVILELNGVPNRSILEETSVSNLRARSEFPIGEIHENGLYDIVVVITYEGEEPPLMYRYVLHTWIQNVRPCFLL